MYRVCRTSWPRSPNSSFKLLHDLLLRRTSPLSSVTTPAAAKFVPATPVREFGDNAHTFESMLASRRAEARRSILVQVSSERSFPELATYCGQFGTIASAHHYCVGGGHQQGDEDCHYIVVEFEESGAADAAIGSAVFNEEKPGVRARSIFLWFRAGPKPKLGVKGEENGKLGKLSSVDGSRVVDNVELRDLLMAAEGVEDQMKILHRTTCLNDVGKRLRFLAVRQVESSLQGMFPQAVAYPFGSSVNGFGKMGCDLDIILDLDSEANLRQSKNSRLVFHTKAANSNERTQVQRQLESIGDVLQLFLPGVNSVRRILKARVPIIKYHHEHLDLEIDLTMNNMTGVHMSELLYLFGQIDPRVQPLTCCVRRWAQSVGLTNQAPGYWITNFSLTMLVMYFLQQLPDPILPPVNRLFSNTSRSDLRISEDQISCSFLRDLSKLDFKTTNETPLDDLLLQFFEFYSHFDFNQRAISLNIGGSILKPDHSPLYIVNPLETVLNVAKNVNLEETELFRIQVRNALWLLDTHDRATTSSGDDWGLVSLLHNKSTIKERITPQMFFTKRLLNVRDIFEDTATATTTTTPPPSAATTQVEFKNRTVQNQVVGIQRATREQIGKMAKHTLSAGAGETTSGGSGSGNNGVKLKRNAKRR